ncbi:hypothetical protein CRG98_012844 [Punica granatum]|uniref:Uncharacterized protein n=1 Tax=Punica granatum TaxID=22663 RepID=A0A2I0KEA2_PUNGR|nr:hypothetical protein CRG98_012844 [Punica granatum]
MYAPPPPPRELPPPPHPPCGTGVDCAALTTMLHHRSQFWKTPNSSCSGQWRALGHLCYTIHFLHLLPNRAELNSTRLAEPRSVEPDAAPHQKSRRRASVQSVVVVVISQLNPELGTKLLVESNSSSTSLCVHDLRGDND